MLWEVGSLCSAMVEEGLNVVYCVGSKGGAHECGNGLDGVNVLRSWGLDIYRCLQEWGGTHEGRDCLAALWLV